MSTTTCRLLTPPGPGGIALIRVVGPDCLRIVSTYFRPQRDPSLDRNESARVRFGAFVDGGELLDDVTVCWASHSKPPFVDITAHGGPRIVQRLLAALEAAGASVETDPRPAWPVGNAIESEALAAITAAKTARAAVFCAYQRIHLPAMLSNIAASCAESPEKAATELQELIDGYPTAKALLQGQRIALIGPPNSGKSTLFNQLVGRTAAVVSPIAGTTRDWVSADIEYDGIPITLLDTPGRHITPDDLERQALHAAEAIVLDLDAMILVLDSTASLPSDLSDLLRIARQADRAIIALNKNDQPSDTRNAMRMTLARLEQSLPSIHLSAQTGSACDYLVPLLVRELIPSEPRVSLFSERQHHISQNVLEYLASGKPALAAETIHHQLIFAPQDDAESLCL